MKAEHRKELHTNLLADQMGRFLQGVKSGPRSRSLVVWVFVILAVGMFAVWQYYASATYAQRSGLWVQIDGALHDAPEQMAETLHEIATQNKGTIPARVARFGRARLLLQEGLEALVSDRREQAILKIRTAQELYEQLARETVQTPLLQQEAMMGVAKAEEALIGLPRSTNGEEASATSIHSLERALELYHQLADKHPDSYLGKAAAEHARQLEQNREAVKVLYTELSALAGPKLRPEAKTDTKPELPPPPKLESQTDTKLEPPPETKPAPPPEKPTP
jgi:hypothetical protein